MVYFLYVVFMYEHIKLWNAAFCAFKRAVLNAAIIIIISFVVLMQSGCERNCHVRP